MEVVSIKVDKKVRDGMRRFRKVNWSNVIREAIVKQLKEEEARDRIVDQAEVAEAVRITDSIRRRVANWDSTEEIRKWREKRK